MATASSDGPGAYRIRPGRIELNADRTDSERIRLVFVNTGDRPIQIGSHIHLPDVNAALEFDRAARPRVPPRHPFGHLAALRTRRVA